VRSNFWSTHRLVVGLALLSALSAAACRNSDAARVAIAITSPADGARLLFSDDEAPDQAGVQVTVVARVAGVGSAAAIELLVDDDVVQLGAADVFGDLIFNKVTLPAGEHELSARTVTKSVQSVQSKYTLVGLSIVDPLDQSTLSASADEDPVMADTQLNIKVQGFGLELDELIALRVDGADVDSLTAETDGSVVFARQTLTPGSHTLQAIAGDIMSDVVTVSVDELCPRIDLILPDLAQSSGPIMLGPQDDILGPTCGDEFAIAVVASTDAGDGTTLTVLVNGSARGSAVVDGTVARFGPVVLGNRGSTPSRISFEPQAAGAACRKEIPVDLLVDCEGVSCEISSPASSGFLNAAMDRSLADGFQGDFEVTTDLATIGQPVALIVDGDAFNLLSSRAVPVGSVSIATFSASLSEGPHRMVALCTDATGNVTMSAEANWIVDTIACDVVINAPRADTYFLETDDVDSDDGTQIELMGSVSDDGCDRARAAICGGLPSQPFLPISGTTPVARVTLSTNATQAVCLEVQDVAGNLTRAETLIFFDSDAPLLSITTPIYGARFNLLGNDVDNIAYVADLVPATNACDVAFEVRCSDLETDVTLHEHVSGQPIPGAVAPCDIATSPTTDYPGVARFGSVALPRLGTVAVHARQVAAGGRLVGISAPITLIEDCRAPTLTISGGADTFCGSVLGPSLNPSGTGPSSITRDVTITSDDPVGVSTARLRVLPVGGGSPIADLTDNSAPFAFDDVNFSAFGEHDVVIDATDQAGNAAIAPGCRVSIVDAPALTLDVDEGIDLDNVIEAEDDCDAASGLQIAVSGTTDAPANSNVTITVSNVTHFTTVMCAGMTCSFAVCVDASEGQLLVRAQVSDATKPTAGVIERRVTIDSLPPPLPIADFRADVPPTDAARSGAVTFRWTDVADAGDIALARYDLRCAATPIATEIDWNTAEGIAIDVSPGSAGGQRSVVIEGFALYATRHCTLRGVDLANASTPINGTGVATIDSLALRTVALSGDTAQQLGRAVAAVGDVNGDGLSDFIVGGLGAARVYFGATDLTQPARSVTIDGPGDGFGERVAGLGDVNADGVADFVIAEPDAATVYVFLGRDESATTSPGPRWPTQLDALTDSSITFQSAGGDRFGDALAPAGDVDGDGISDFLIGAPGHDNNRGRLHIVRGRPLCSIDLTTHCLLLGSTTTLGSSGGAVDGFVLTDPRVSVARFGQSSVGLGDVNDDGHDDVAIAAPGSSADTLDAYLILWPGAEYATSDSGIVPIDVSNEPLLSLGAPETAGYALAALRSTTGASLAIRYDNRVQVETLSAPSGTLTLTTEVSLENDLGNSGDEFGRSLAAGLLPGLPAVDCDLDNDGSDDLFVGSVGLSGQPGAGELFYRSSLLANADNALVVARSTADHVTRASTGTRSVACIGDINGDGAPDLLTADSAANSNAGSLTVLY